MAPAEKQIAIEAAVLPAERENARPPAWATWAVQKWVFAALAGIYVALRLSNLAAVCLDGDEIFSVVVASQSWRTLTVAAASDSIHPPLFYFLLKIWMSIGNDSLLWVRILPILFSVLTVVPLLLLGRDLRLRPLEINGTLAIVAFHPFLIFYSQHVRMYSLLMLCALTSIWLFHTIIRSGSRSISLRYVALTAVNAVLVYAHYYGWLVVGLECCYLILWKRRDWKRWLVSLAIVFAACTPWLWMAGRCAYAKGGLGSNLEWIEKPTARDLTWFFVDLAGFGELPAIGRWAAGSLFLLIIGAAWARPRIHRAYPAHRMGYLIFFVLGASGIAFFASRILPSSVWGHRHMIFLAVLFAMLVALAYSRLRSRALRVLGAVLFVRWAFLMARHQVKGDDKKTPFDTLVAQVLQSEGPGSPPVQFFSVDKYLHYPFWFYLEALKAGKITGFAVPLSAPQRREWSEAAARIEVRSNVSIGEARGRHFWVGYSSSWREKVSPETVMLARGCRVGGNATVRDRFHSVTIFPVWCDL